MYLVPAQHQTHIHVHCSLPNTNPTHIYALFAAQYQPHAYMYIVRSTTSGTSASQPSAARCSFTRAAGMWAAPCRMSSATRKRVGNRWWPESAKPRGQSGATVRFIFGRFSVISEHVVEGAWLVCILGGIRLKT